MVKPFLLRARWTTGELREIDFNALLNPYKNKPDSIIGQLLQSEIFEKIKLDPESQTQYWDGLIKMRLRMELLYLPF